VVGTGPGARVRVHGAATGGRARFG
jgi:hypothetical protein